MGLRFCSYTSLNLVFWLLLFYPTLAYHTSRQPLCHDNERAALLQFKESLIIKETVSSYPSAHPKIRSWKVEEGNSNCCSWDGIKCNEDTGHVMELDLTSSYLYGSINSNSSLFHLVHLEWLSLADNYFNHSEIPSAVVNLSRLTHLDLSYSGFSGQMPSEILELSKLVFLNVSSNDGLELRNGGLKSLPEMLSKLKVLDLDRVNIFSPIPHTLANLSSLSFLSLEDCELQGESPTEIFQLPKLSFLNLRYNRNLIVRLPDFKKNNSLEELRLTETRFAGGIPNSIGNLVSLSVLDISFCNVNGTVPPSLGNLFELTYLDLSVNNFFNQENCSLFWISNLTKLTYLDLNANKFSSQNISSLIWIANLTKLTQLDLSYNEFSSQNFSLFSWIGNFTKLTHLILSDINLVGEIPTWLLNLNQLQFLCLSDNQLTGAIPFEIGNFIQLETLDLGSNLLEGPIPNSIFELKNLASLDLASNNLSGSLDLDMFFIKLRSLAVLVLSSNNLSLLSKTTVYTNLQNLFVIGLGSCNLTAFPNFLQNQDQLVSLDLSSNKIAGLIPRWLLSVGTDSLEYLNLSNNLLTGFDQNSIVLPWNALDTLDLRSNKLQGPLPFPPISIFTYLVSDNQLTGLIPLRICNLNGLHALDLSYNNLSGTLPPCLGNFSDKLSVLKLQHNKFHGSIPQIFLKGKNLRMIDLSFNLLSGRVPRTLASCTTLEFVSLGSNQIDDTFPSWLGTLPRLKVLNLQRNKFHGVIEEPKTEVEFPELRIIDLSHNTFAGNLPSKYFHYWNAMKVVNASKMTYMQDDLVPEIIPIYTHYDPFDYSLTLSNKGIDMEYGKLSNLVTGIVLSNNEFGGEIPASIGNLKGLHNLNLSNNHIQGHIPSSFANLTILESLDLSNNKISGEIPQNLVELTALEYFNVSHNDLTGLIPQGNQFSTFENSSFDGNSGLCGKPLSKQCKIPNASKKGDQGSGPLFAFGWRVVAIGYVSGLIIGVVLGHIFTTKKREWFAKTFGWQLKRIAKKKAK